MIKFAIWGIGTRGRLLYYILGRERIEVYIDNDVQKQKDGFEGIKVISSDEYSTKYRNFPIIITPKNFEMQILHSLKREGIYWAFTYSESFYEIEAFLKQAPKERLLMDIPRDVEVGIEYSGAYSLLLYEYMKTFGWNCRFFFNELMEKELIDFIKERLKCDIDKDTSNVECIIWTSQKERYRQVNLQKTQLNMCNVGLMKNLYQNTQIKKFYQKHRGKRIFIVATGPSLLIEDLDKLYSNQELSISVNYIFKAFDKTKWRPTYYGVSDPNIVSKWKKEILQMECSGKFISDVAWDFSSEEVEANMYRYHMYDIPYKDKPCFSEDFSRGTYAAPTVTYVVGMQLAAYMGAREIYLLGVDCNYVKGSCNNHFVKEKEADNYAHNEDGMITAYMAAREYAEQHGIKIYNATRGGKLQVFERVDFDMLFD